MSGTIIESIEHLNKLLEEYRSNDYLYIKDFEVTIDSEGRLGRPGAKFYVWAEHRSEDSGMQVYMCSYNPKGLLAFLNEAIASDREEGIDSLPEIWDWVESYVYSKGIQVIHTCHG